MSFNSLDFLVFFLAFLAAWALFRTRGTTARCTLITLASFLFYGWWDWRFLTLIIASGLIDYVVSLQMVRTPRRRHWLMGLSILGNIGILAVFKYLDFALGNLNNLLSLTGADLEPFDPVGLALPVGISFYTFQSLSYSIDVYRGRLAPTTNLMQFFAYLSMFPQLVAGPIVRAAHLLPQLATPQPISWEDRWEGSGLIVRGLFKKVVIADQLAPFVEATFGTAEPGTSTALWWIVMIAFAVQIYGDFSGYSDMARGLARWLGYRYPVNFDHPYTAVSIREFWTRWHISLSTWFRDYVYLPLGGNRRGPVRGHLNMWVAMLVSGLWHGAAWNFIAWGAMHAAYISFERITGWPERLVAAAGLPGRVLATIAVFILVILAWVPFRAATLEQTLEIWAVMLSLNELELAAARAGVYGHKLALGFAVLALGREAFFWAGFDRHGIWARRWYSVYAQPVIYGLLACACLFLRGPASEFIYFQF